MAIASAKDVRDYYIVEPDNARGAFPGSGNLTPFPFEELGLSPTPLRNPVYLRADAGQRSALGYSGVDYNGDMSGALLSESVDVFLESIFQGRFLDKTAPASKTVGTNTANGATTLPVNSGAGISRFDVFTIGSDTTVYTVLDISANNLTITPALAQDSSAGDSLTFQDREILINAANPKTFSVERRIAHPGGMTYEQYSGVEVTTGSFTVANGENVQFAGSLIATALNTPSSGVNTNRLGSLSADQKKIIGSGSNIRAVRFIGSDTHATGLNEGEVINPDLDNVSLDFNVEGREPQRKIGSEDLVGIADGAMRPNVSATAYFGANYQKFLNAAVNLQEFVFIVEMQAVSGKGYRFIFPRCTFGSITKSITGIEPIEVSLPIVPLAAERTAFDDTTANWGTRNISAATVMVDRNLSL